MRGDHDVELEDQVISEEAAAEHNNKPSNQEVNGLPDSCRIVIKSYVCIGILILLSEIPVCDLIIILSQEEVHPDRKSDHYYYVGHHQKVREVAAPAGPHELIKVDDHSEGQFNVRRHTVVYGTVPE